MLLGQEEIDHWKPQIIQFLFLATDFKLLSKLNFLKQESLLYINIFHIPEDTQAHKKTSKDKREQK